MSAIVGMLLVGISILLPEPLMEWIAVPGGVLVALSLVLFFSSPGLHCPSCGKASDSGFDAFCPACGGQPLPKSFWTGTHCDACGRNLGNYNYRNYPIRYCTHCGVLLNRQGV